MQFGPPVELSAHQRLCVSGGRFLFPLNPLQAGFFV